MNERQLLNSGKQFFAYGCEHAGDIDTSQTNENVWSAFKDDRQSATNPYLVPVIVMLLLWGTATVGVLLNKTYRESVAKYLGLNKVKWELLWTSK